MDCYLSEENEHFYKIHSQNITNEIIYLFIDQCRDKKYNFMIAPFEADS